MAKNSTVSNLFIKHILLIAKSSHIMYIGCMRPYEERDSNNEGLPGLRSEVQRLDTGLTGGSPDHETMGADFDSPTVDGLPIPKGKRDPDDDSKNDFDVSSAALAARHAKAAMQDPNVLRQLESGSTITRNQMSRVGFGGDEEVLIEVPHETDPSKATGDEVD